MNELDIIFATPWEITLWIIKLEKCEEMRAIQLVLKFRPELRQMFGTRAEGRRDYE